ncbi:MAG: DNA primase [Chloroflexota bacterium]
MDDVEEIKSRLPIEDLVGGYVDLKRAGSTLKGLCPFHQEKTPSFIVTPNRGTFHCFGCGKGGDIFTFLMETEHLPFPETLKELAARAGVTLAQREPAKASLTGRLYEANETAAGFYRDALHAQPGARARDYLEKRAFDRAAMELFDLGWAPSGRDALVQHLRRRGFEDRILLAAGLAMQEDIGGGLRDRFHGRLMFPIRDVKRRVSGFGGRILDDGQPKYLNSPQTEIFDKSGVLYGVHLAAEDLRKGGRGVLVEGYLDCLRAHRAGFPWTVASLGTAVTVPQLAALSRLTDIVVLALDPDPAGQAAAARTALTALAEVTQARGRATGGVGAVDLRIATLPADAGDPDELIRDNPARWHETVEQAIPAFEFFFQQTLRGLDRSDDAWRQRAIDQLLPVIQQFAGSAGWQATWLQRLGQETGIDTQVLHRSLPGAPAARRAGRGTTRRPGAESDVMGGTTARAVGTTPVEGMESSFLAFLLTLVVVPDDMLDELRLLSLERPEHQQLLEGILRWSQTGNYDYEMLAETLPDEIRPLANDLQARQMPLPVDEKIRVGIALHLARMRRFRVLAQIERTRQAVADTDTETQLVAVNALGRLIAEQGEVERTLDQLSQFVLQATSYASADQGTIDQESGSL